MAMMTSTAVLLEFLAHQGVSYQTFSHEVCRSSDECARVRSAHGAGHAIGAKALVMRCVRGGEMRMFVLPGNRKLDNRALRERVGSCRLASAAELLWVTGGLVPGAVPPLILPTMSEIRSIDVDVSLRDHHHIGFNAASLTQSVIMPTVDYFSLIGAGVVVSRFTSV